jgi:hypothetical protein
MYRLDKLLCDVVITNRILANERVIDALGHVSIRHADRPDCFFLSCSRSPELVTLGWKTPSTATRSTGLAGRWIGT